MQLPRVTLGPVQNDVSPALAQVSRAAGQLSDTLAEGFTVLGQEMVKSQTQEANLAFSKSLDETERWLSGREAISVEEAKAKLGTKWDSLPKEIRERPIVPTAMKDPTTGQETVVDREQDIPVHLIGEVLFDHEAEQALAKASTHITVGQGWQSRFQAAAREDLQARRLRLSMQTLKAMGDAAVEDQTRQVIEAAWAGSYGPEGDQENLGLAGAYLNGSLRVLGTKGVEELRQKVQLIKQVKPVYDALRMVNLPAYREEGVKQLEAAQLRLGDPARFSDLSPEQRAGLSREVRAALDAARQINAKASGARIAFTIATGSRDERNPERINSKAAYDKLDAMVASGEIADGEVATETRRLLGEHIRDREAASRQELNAVAGEAMGQFMAIGPDGKPRLSFSNLTPATIAGLRRYGEDGEKVLEALIKWDQSDESHQRSIRQMPSQAESARAFSIERSIALRPGDWRNMSGPEQLAVLSGAAPVPGEPEAPAVAISSRDVPELGRKIAALSAPPTTKYVTDPAKIAFEEAEKKFPGLKARRPAPETREAFQLLNDRLADFIARERGDTDRDPPQERIRAEAARLLETVEIRDRILKFLPGGGIPVTRETTRMQAEAAGAEAVREPTAAPAPARVPPPPKGTPNGWIPYRNRKTGEVRYNAPGKAKGDWTEAR